MRCLPLIFFIIQLLISSKLLATPTNTARLGTELRQRIYQIIADNPETPASDITNLRAVDRHARQYFDMNSIFWRFRFRFYCRGVRRQVEYVFHSQTLLINERLLQNGGCFRFLWTYFTADLVARQQRQEQQPNQMDPFSVEYLKIAITTWGQMQEPMGRHRSPICNFTNLIMIIGKKPSSMRILLFVFVILRLRLHLTSIRIIKQGDRIVWPPGMCDKGSYACAAIRSALVRIGPQLEHIELNTEIIGDVFASDHELLSKFWAHLAAMRRLRTLRLTDLSMDHQLGWSPYTFFLLASKSIESMPLERLDLSWRDRSLLVSESSKDLPNHRNPLWIVGLFIMCHQKRLKHLNLRGDGTISLIHAVSSQPRIFLELESVFIEDNLNDLHRNVTWQTEQIFKQLMQLPKLINLAFPVLNREQLGAIGRLMAQEEYEFFLWLSCLDQRLSDDLVLPVWKLELPLVGCFDYQSLHSIEQFNIADGNVVGDAVRIDALLFEQHSRLQAETAMIEFAGNHGLQVYNAGEQLKRLFNIPDSAGLKYNLLVLSVEPVTPTQLDGILDFINFMPLLEEVAIWIVDEPEAADSAGLHDNSLLPLLLHSNLQQLNLVINDMMMHPYHLLPMLNMIAEYAGNNFISLTVEIWEVHFEHPQMRQTLERLIKEALGKTRLKRAKIDIGTHCSAPSEELLEIVWSR